MHSLCIHQTVWAVYTLSCRAIIRDGSEEGRLTDLTESTSGTGNTIDAEFRSYCCSSIIEDMSLCERYLRKRPSIPIVPANAAKCKQNSCILYLWLFLAVVNAGGGKRGYRPNLLEKVLVNTSTKSLIWSQFFQVSQIHCKYYSPALLSLRCYRTNWSTLYHIRQWRLHIYRCWRLYYGSNIFQWHTSIPPPRQAGCNSRLGTFLGQSNGIWCTRRVRLSGMVL